MRNDNAVMLKNSVVASLRIGLVCSLCRHSTTNLSALVVPVKGRRSARPWLADGFTNIFNPNWAPSLSKCEAILFPFLCCKNVGFCPPVNAISCTCLRVPVLNSDLSPGRRLSSCRLATLPPKGRGSPTYPLRASYQTYKDTCQRTKTNTKPPVCGGQGVLGWGVCRRGRGASKRQESALAILFTHTSPLT